jgi:atrazine chlorohydrolase/5-methylthioadenosine/S-adenosylhomocysteine deaminase/melamine deaminase
MWTLHLDESPYDKRAALLGGYEWLEAHHALDGRLLAAHCVHASSRDVRLLRRHDVKVAHQATSNGYLASGTAPIPEMLQAGITVGLGTDDANCNDGVNLFADMKVMYLAQRARTLDPGVVTPEKIVEAVTIDAARAVGMADRIGSLEPGKQADLITVDLAHPQTTPAHDLCATLVLQAYGTEVDTVVVAGDVIMRGRRLRFLAPEDERAFYADAAARSARIVADSGLRATRPWTTVGG